MKDFLVSYNSSDRSWAEWIAWQLEEAGYTTMLQAWDFKPGSNFAQEMQQAAAKAERIIAVLSPGYLDARLTQSQWAAAFAQDPTGKKGTLLPVRVRECNLKGLLPQIVYVDLLGLEEAAAKDTLLTEVRKLAKPTVSPGSPGAAQRSVPKQPRFPGALPPIWNVPHHRNPNFTGRESLLAELWTALKSGRPIALTQDISGLGGVGKTQLAVEYAYRHATEYDVVWWVRAEEPTTLAADYATLAGPLDLSQKEASDHRFAVRAVRRWLGQHKNWLLVFDDVRGLAKVRGYLPQGATGHLLVISLNPYWQDLVSPLTVPVLERAEAVDFLLKRTGQVDEEAAAALAEALGDLPLALEQAGAYVGATGTPLADYLELFRSQRTELRDEEHPSLSYPHTVATTWSLAMERIREESPASVDLLNLYAYLGPDDIPRTLLSKGKEHIPEPLSAVVTDLSAMDKAMAALQQYSLVEMNEDALSVHRLVQAVARDRLPEDARKTWAKAAVRLVNGVFPSGMTEDAQTWPECARLLPHALAAAGHAEALEVASGAMGRLLNQVGLYLRERAEFAGAKAALERALAIDKAAFGPDHPKVAIRINNLGRVLKDLGDLEGARAAFERALAINEATFGPDHLKVAIRVNNLGGVLQDLGDLEGARAAYERALAILEQSLEPGHPSVASAANNLGGVLQDLGDLEGARAAFERALAINEAAFGPDHPKVATDANNLGTVLRNLGDLEGARAAFERALTVGKAAFGPDHPKVATCANNLGMVLQDLGDLKGAQAAYERVLGILEKTLPPEHPHVAATVNNLGLVLQDLGDLEGARAAFERALAVGEAAFGPDHPKVATHVNNLGMVLQDLGDLEGARAAYERVLGILEKTLPPEHPYIAATINDLGLVLKDLGDLDGARVHFERALSIDEAAHGPNHPEVARDVNNLGLVLRDLGDLEGARAAFERALRILREFWGEDHPHTVTVQNNLDSLRA